MSGLPENVRLLAEALEGVEDLEVLLLLARAPGRHWSAKEIATALHVSSDITPVVERLARMNLVDIKLAQDVLYRYVDGEPWGKEAVRMLGEEYMQRRLLVIESLRPPAPRVSGAVRGFADAFRIRRTTPPKKRRTGERE